MSIVLDKLTKGYADHRVVDRVSLEVAEGEFFVLLGASGSGKSTILRMIAGLTHPDSGTILLHGRDVTHLAPQPRGTGFVFQNYSIFRHMSVAENIGFGLKIRKVTPAERAKRCDELLEMVGMGGLGDRRADELSGGQQQRVALARALTYQPAVLLLDEPLGALDVKIRAQLRRSLKEIQRSLAVTTILVTHDQEEAFELADRIGVMDRGVLLEVGEPEQLYSRPRSLTVASFLGTGTVLAGRTAEGRAHFGPFVLPLPEDQSHDEGAPVEILARPEQVVLSSKEPSGHAPVLGKGEIIEENFTGPLRRLRLRLPRIPATRQISPLAPFGEVGILVDAVVAAENDVPKKEVWVSLRGWSILGQAPPRLMLVETLPGSPTAMGIARELSVCMGASMTVMGFTGDEEVSEEQRAGLGKRVAEAGFRHAEMHVRSGDFHSQLSVECSGTLFEMLILPPRLTEGPVTSLDPDIASTLIQPEAATLIAKGEPRDIKRILICTRLGESGKLNVRVGGRMARHLGASVTLLHVMTGTGKIGKPAQAHLEKASATLSALDVPNEIRMTNAATPMAGIVNEAGGHDLIVLGSHLPRARPIFGDFDVTRQIVRSARCPVLIMPAQTL